MKTKSAFLAAGAVAAFGAVAILNTNNIYADEADSVVSEGYIKATSANINDVVTYINTWSASAADKPVVEWNASTKTLNFNKDNAVNNLVELKAPLDLVSGDYTINLNGVTLKVKRDANATLRAYYIIIEKDAKLTIKGQGTFDATDASTMFETRGGNLTIENGVFKGNSFIYKPGIKEDIGKVPNLNVKGGTFTASSAAFSTGGVNATFDGGDITANSGIYVGSGLAGSGSSTVVKASKTIINGGTVKATTAGGSAVHFDNIQYSTNHPDSELVINGGDFASDQSSALWWNYKATDKLTLNGGTFAVTGGKVSSYSFFFSDLPKDFDLNTLLGKGKMYCPLSLNAGRDIATTSSVTVKITEVGACVVDGDVRDDAGNGTTTKKEKTKNPNTADSNGANGALISVGAGVTGALGLVAAVLLRRRRA